MRYVSLDFQTGPESHVILSSERVTHDFSSHNDDNQRNMIAVYVEHWLFPVLLPNLSWGH